MRPILFSVLGIGVPAYGVSKALAAPVGAVGPVGPVGPDAPTPRSAKAEHAGPARPAARAPAQCGPHAASEVHLLLGAFVLGGLDAEDVRTFATHMAGCARCRAELPDGRAVAAALALAGSRERRP